jgi:hypothetical protein
MPSTEPASPGVGASTDDNPPRKYLRVAAAVRAQIAAGALRPGQPAPSGAALSRLTGFSVLTCRRGLRALIADGVLTPGPSRNARPRVAGAAQLPGEQDAAAAGRALSAGLSARRRAAGLTQPELAARAGSGSPGSSGNGPTARSVPAASCCGCTTRTARRPPPRWRAAGGHPPWWGTRVLVARGSSRARRRATGSPVRSPALILLARVPGPWPRTTRRWLASRCRAGRAGPGRPGCGQPAPGRNPGRA